MGNTDMFTGRKFISSLIQPILLLVTSSSYIYGIDISSKNPRINFTIPANHPYSLAQDSNNGNIFVTRVSEVTKVSLGPNGTIKSEVIAGMEGPGNNDGSLETAQFGSLSNIIILAESKLLVTDSTNHNLRLLDLKTQQTSSICSGNTGHQDGSMSDCTLYYPQSLMVLNDSVYVGGFQQIRRFHGKLKSKIFRKKLE